MVSQKYSVLVSDTEAVGIIHPFINAGTPIKIGLSGPPQVPARCGWYVRPVELQTGPLMLRCVAVFALRRMRRQVHVRQDSRCRQHRSGRQRNGPFCFCSKPHDMLSSISDTLIREA